MIYNLEKMPSKILKTDIQVKNTTITSASISNGDHGVLSAWLSLDYGGLCQGFGGYSLYLPKDFKHSINQKNYAGHFIWRVLEIASVTEWGRLVGKTIRVKSEHLKIHAIGHITKDDWFNPTDDFDKMKNNDV